MQDNQNRFRRTLLAKEYPLIQAPPSYRISHGQSVPLHHVQQLLALLRFLQSLLPFYESFHVLLIIGNSLLIPPFLVVVWLFVCWSSVSGLSDNRYSLSDRTKLLSYSKESLSDRVRLLS